MGRNRPGWGTAVLLVACAASVARCGGRAIGETAAAPREDAGSRSGGGGGGRTMATGGSTSTGGTEVLAFGGATTSTGGQESVGLDGAVCNVDSHGTANVDFGILCTLLDCRTTAAQVLTGYVCRQMAAPGASGDFGRRTVGCGVEIIAFNGGYGGATYVFDEGTGKLVGARYSSDVNFGECNAFEYAGGASGEPCADAVETTCLPAGTVD